ncbi:unnamed protein product [Camellia sinensis]
MVVMADVGVEGDGCDMCVGSGGCDGGHQVFDKSPSRTKSSLCDVMWCGSQAARVTVVHCMLVTGNSIEIHSFVRMWGIARQKLGAGGFPVPRIQQPAVFASFVRMWRIARQKLGAGGFPVPRIQQLAVSALRCYSSATKEVSSFNRNLNSAKFQSSIFGIVVPGKPSSLQ